MLCHSNSAQNETNLGPNLTVATAINLHGNISGTSRGSIWWNSDKIYEMIRNEWGLWEVQQKAWHQISKAGGKKKKKENGL